MLPLPPQSTLFPYTTLFRSKSKNEPDVAAISTAVSMAADVSKVIVTTTDATLYTSQVRLVNELLGIHPGIDRKSTRLNSSHSSISYAVFCLKKKTKRNRTTR